MKPAVLQKVEAPSLVELDSNESPLGPSRNVSRALTEAMARVGRYPERDCSHLEERVARLHKVTGSHVIVGPGGFGVLRLIADACMPAGSEVIYADPSYPIYRYLANKAGCRAVAVPLTPDHRHDLPAMARAIGPATRVVFICNPNNPTGRAVSVEELTDFMSQVPPHVLVVLDEAYYEYASGPDMPNGMDWVRSGHNVLVLRTFSKAYGLASLRVGYGVAPPHVAAMIRQARDPFVVNAVAQVAAKAALEDWAHVAAVRAFNDQVREELCTRVEQMGLRYIPSVTNFVMIECGGDDVAVTERLAEEGILVRPGSEYGMRGWLRVTVGTTEQIRFFLSVLQAILASR